MQLTTKEKIFSILIALYPLLGVYRSPINGVDIGTFCLIVFFVFTVSRKVCLDDVSWLVLYVLIQTSLLLLGSTSVETSMATIILRYGKFLISLGMVFLFGLMDKYYHEDYTFRVIKVVCYISGIFIVVQRVFYLFGVVITNPLLSFATNESYTSGYSMISGMLFRPSAFFLEPAHMALYGIVFLCYSLFKTENIKDAIIVSIAVLCTGSGIGLISVIGSFAIYALIRFKTHIVRTIGILIIGGSAMLYFSKTLFFQQVINRFTTDNVMGGGVMQLMPVSD